MTLPEHWNFARDVVDRFAAEPDRPALLYRDGGGRDTRFSFGELSREISRMADAYERLGLRRGEAVLVLLPPLPEWQIAVIGAMARGLIAVPTSIAALDARDIEHRARHSEAVAVLATRDHVDTLDDLARGLPALRHRILVSERHAEVSVPPEGWLHFAEVLETGDPEAPRASTRIDEPALVLYTSGTTGPPKAVLHSHAYPFAAGRQASWWHGLRSNDRFWPTTGWAKAAFVPWSCGAEIIVTRSRLDPIDQLRALESLAPNVFCAPPTQYRQLVALDLRRFHAPALRECVSAGEPMNPETIDAWQVATGLRIRDGYGQSEAGLLLANAAAEPSKRGSMGRPLPGVDIAILDQAGRRQPDGAEGDLAVRLGTPGLFIRYWKDEAATRAVRRGDWYLTGDRAYRDGDGDYFFVGRSDDVILCGSERIGPFEIESRLVEHESVVEAAAIAAPHPVLGQVALAYVVLRADGAREASSAESPTGGSREREDLEGELAGLFPVESRRPARFIFVTSLPKTATGKIRRGDLREQAARDRATESSRTL